MKVQLVLGRSGSGKTHWCLEAIRRELAGGSGSAGGQGSGEALILLVPEQATFQMEQALLAGGRTGGERLEGLSGYHRVRVMSFHRLALQILGDTCPAVLSGGEGRGVLSETAKQMIIRYLLQEHQGELAVFSRSANRGGFIAQLSGLFRELRQYCRRPEDLQAERERLAGSGLAEWGPLVEKLGDLERIYRAYLGYIEGRFVDPDDFLDLVVPCCGRAEVLRGAKVWVDGFAGFTPQQYAVLEAVLAQAEAGWVTLCLDWRAEQYGVAASGAAARGRLDVTDLFHPILETCWRLNRLFGGAGFAVRPPLRLPEGTGGMPRFRGAEQLGQLEREIFGGRVLKQAGQAVAEAPLAGVAVVEAGTRRAEVEAAARQILRLCRERGYRFRDIAVILRDFTDYQTLIEAVFGEYGIAYFLDQRRPVRYHPVVELLRAAATILGTDFRTEAVFSYLKTDLTGLERGAVDTLENYVLAEGVQPGQWCQAEAWKVSERWGEPIDAYRRAAVEPLRRMRESLYGAGGRAAEELPVRRITAELAELLERIGLRERLWQWYQEAAAAGRLEEASVHEQMYEGVVGLFDDLAETLGEVKVTAGEYGEILAAALSQMTLKLVPPALDQVLVGTIERSRHPQIRAALVLGVNEGRFPRAAGEETFFSEGQRERLAQDELELAPSRTERLFDERYLGYIAFTRASEFLWVSYAAADEQGGSLNRSSLVEAVLAAVPGAALVRLGGQWEPKLERIDNRPQLARQLAAALAGLRTGQEVGEEWLALYRAATGRSEGAYLREVLQGIGYQNRAELRAEAAERLLAGGSLTSSVSRLESFAACPFQHFAKYLLKLEEREELKLAAVDMGSFYHDAICAVYEGMRKRRMGWRELGEGAMEELVGEVTERLLAGENPVGRLYELSHRNRYLLNSARQRLLWLCRSVRAAAAAGAFEQRYAELEFGPGRTLPGLVLELAGGKKVVLYGKIDRVDVGEGEEGRAAVAVVDYKSSGRAFPFSFFYHGLSLQLITYLEVLLEQRGRLGLEGAEPAAVLYFPIYRKGREQEGELPEDMEGWLRAMIENYQPQKIQGVISSGWGQRLDETAELGKSSRFYSFQLLKDGSGYSKKSAVVSPEQMGALLAHNRANLAELGGRILAGQIEVAPYRCGKMSPCSFCEFQPLCRFDFRSDVYRYLPYYSRAEVLEKLGGAGERGGNHHG